MTICFIGIGKITSFFKYMVAFIIFNILKDYCYQNYSFEQYQLTGSLFKYCGFTIFGCIFYYISISLNKNTKKPNSNNSNENKLNQLIYKEARMSIEFENKNLLYFICLFYVIFLESIQLLNFYGFEKLFIWTMDFLSMFIFTQIYFPQKMYKHQKCSILFIVIIDTALLIIASLCKISGDENIYQQKTIILCIGIILLFICITSLNSFDRVRIKKFIDNQFVSPYQIVFIIGLFGFIINLILSIFFLIRGNNCSNNDISIDYYGNISCYFKEKENFTLKIIYAIFYMFFYFICLTCEFFIIKYLDQFHVSISDVIYFEIWNLVSYYKSNTNLIQSILIQIAEGFAFIGFCIFLEIIELKFCELDTNIRKNILKREKEDSYIEVGSDDQGEIE